MKPAHPRPWIQALWNRWWMLERKRRIAATTNGLQTEIDLETSAIEKITGSISHPAPTGNQRLQVYSNGVVNIGRTLFSLTKRMGGRTVVATWDREGVMFANTEGEVIAEYAWPSEGTGYVGISKSLTRFRR